MMGKTHLVISTGVTLSVLGLLNQTITLPVIAVAAVSSLLPDIDEPNALLVSRAIPKSFLRFIQLTLIGLGIYVQLFGSAFAPYNTILAVLVGLISFMPTRTLRNVIMILIGVALIFLGKDFIPWNYIIGCILVICGLVQHRGITHTVFGLVGWSTLLYFATHTYGNVLWMAGGLSYALHLLADSLTDHGIRPIPPLEFRLRFRLMSTGSWSGSIVESVCIGLTVILVWYVFLRDLNFSSFT